MRRGKFDEAAERFEECRLMYEKMRDENPGEGYEWIEEKLAFLNVFIRTAREQAYTGNPLPVPEGKEERPEESPPRIVR